MTFQSLSSQLPKLPLVTIGKLQIPEGAWHRPDRIKRKSSYYKGRGKDGRKYAEFKWPLGHEDEAEPHFMQFPLEQYYQPLRNQKEYPPLSLLKLQRLIDIKLLDDKKLIDLAAICNTKRILVNIAHNHYGINLTDEGADSFKAKVHIEVQHATEVAIAVIEKNGGTIQTKFYDRKSLNCATNVKDYFKTGDPIPRVKMPSSDVYEYYTDPKLRGYLVDQKEIDRARFETSQKFGFAYTESPLILARKGKHHIFEHLKPGWVVDLDNKCILKPKDKEYIDFYEFEE
ncbi:MAG: YmL15 [Marteilia pararefringens]